MAIRTHNRRFSLLARLLGLAALAVAMLAGSVETQARLDPYYFLRGKGFSTLRPRIVFVLDTSGSMTWEVGTGGSAYANAWWDEAEGTDIATMSRVRAARLAINAVVTQSQDLADFSLMTFNMYAPPTSDPGDCGRGGYRFYWVDQWLPEQAGWSSITNQFNQTGAWMLCESGVNRPYTYIRWDDLGFTDPSILQDSAKNDPGPPAGPLFSPTGLGTQAEFEDTSDNSPMRWRKVQWFDRFLGVRFHVDCTDNQIDSMAQLAAGDYSYSEVCGHDFYYVPYVDGHSFYSRLDVRGSNPNCSGGGGLVCPVPPTQGAYLGCLDQDAAGNLCRVQTSPGTFVTCNSTYGWSTCYSAYDTGGWNGSGQFANYTWYSECNSLGNAADQEACCEYIGNSRWGAPDACKGMSGATYDDGSSCADQTCCENIGLQALGDPEGCKDYDMICPVPEVVDHCGTNTGNSTVTLDAGTQHRAPTDAASLQAPFYFEPAIAKWDNPSFTPSDQAKAGPLTEAEANGRVLGLSDHAIYGGVDADGGTPWTQAVGTIPTGAPGAAGGPPDSNKAYSHTSVGSYLKYITHQNNGDNCRPVYAVLLSDGHPDSTFGLYPNIAALRTGLGVKTFVVGFGVSGGSITNMACAGAGVSSGSCAGGPAPGNNNWDTCQNPNQPADATDGCAYIADDPQQLYDALIKIISGALNLDVPSGPGTNQPAFNLGPGGDEAKSFQINATTDYPDWRGHVTRAMCNEQDYTDIDKDGITAELSPACEVPTVRTNEMATFNTYGPCTGEFVWDAAECLKQTKPFERRMYSFDEFKRVYPIHDGQDPPNATAQFRSEVNRVTGMALTNAEATDFARFLLGYDWPGGSVVGNGGVEDGYKLPGLANSAPITVDRVPAIVQNQIPSVGINDIHCSGRHSPASGDVEQHLRQFSIDSWKQNGNDYDYQEAVVIGDDLGIIHAFQQMSGNELFGLIPPFAFKSAWDQSQIGPATAGQPSALDQHNFGVAGTVNRWWTYDHNTKKWHHLAIIGMGVGGNEFMVLDLSHMGRVKNDDPVTVMWTTEDPALRGQFEQWLGETWSRPALTMRFDTVNDEEYASFDATPDFYFVLTSGYDAPSGTQRVWMLDAHTGQELEHADFPAFNPALSYDSEYGVVADPAVGTHCHSAYWGEAQEVYFADPDGRLFRWDQGWTNPAREHEADGDPNGTRKWSDNGDVAIPSYRFHACRDNGSGACVVDDANRIGDPFLYSPAVVANNRLDDLVTAANVALDKAQQDQFLLAMVSGAINDDETNATGTDHHTSLYMLVDNHLEDPTTGRHHGFNIPGLGGDITQPGAHPDFMRLPITGIVRTRVVNFPDGSQSAPETRPFGKETRAIRSPRINIKGVVDCGGDPACANGVFKANQEVAEVSFYVYEPGDQACDPRWKNPNTGLWEFDAGSTYEIAFRLTVDDSVGFNFVSGSGDAAFNQPWGGQPAGAGLTPARVTQLGQEGPKPTPPPNPPCPPTGGQGGGSGAVVVPIAWSEITGFTPVE